MPSNSGEASDRKPHIVTVSRLRLAPWQRFSPRHAHRTTVRGSRVQERKEYRFDPPTESAARDPLFLPLALPTSALQQRMSPAAAAAVPYQLLPGGGGAAQPRPSRNRLTSALQSRPARLAALLLGAVLTLVALASLAARGPASTSPVQIAKAAIDKTTTTVHHWVGDKLGLVGNHDHDDSDADLPPYEPPTLDELRTLVGDHPRYLTKDGWATYGYNNQRYMLEATLALARIAGRIPVLPDAVWARACAADPDDICAERAEIYFEHRNEHQDLVAAKWNDDGKAYKLGLQHFLDIPHLRKTYGPLLLYSEYFALYNLSSSLMDESLRWRPDRYTPPGLESVTIPDSVFQNDSFVRIDTPPPSRSAADESVGFSGGRLEQLPRSKVAKLFSTRPAWTLPAARSALQRDGILESDGISDAALVRMLEPAGVLPLYTYDDSVLMNKAVARPVVELALKSNIQPFTTTLLESDSSKADIVYLSGNLHDQRKPGGVWFSTAAARDDFTRTVVRGIRAPREIRQVGERLAARMQDRVAGKPKPRRKQQPLWMAAHLRRGDFVEIEWSPDKNATVHFDKVLEALREGRKALAGHVASDLQEQVPREGDP